MKLERLNGNYLFPQYVPLLGVNQSDDEWNKADMHLLFVFPTDISTKAVSQSHVTLYNIVKLVQGSKAFVDICFLPPEYSFNAYYKSIPAIVGNFSKRTWDDFDIVGFSVASPEEDAPNAYYLFKKAGIQFSHQERLADDKMPLIVLGGIAADQCPGLHDMFDMVMIGLGERLLNTFIEKAYEVQAQCGSVKKGKATLVQRLKSVRGCYYPHGYHYNHFLEDGKIVSEYKGHDEDVPEYVYPDTALPIDKYGYLSDSVINNPLPGCNTKSSILSTWGCGAAGSCNFSVRKGTRLLTDKGLLKIESVKDSTKNIHSLDMSSCKDILFQGKKDIKRVWFSHNYYLDCDSNHKWMVWKDNYSLEEKITSDLSTSDVVLYKLGTNYFGSYDKDNNLNPEDYELLGFITGDGSYGRETKTKNTIELRVNLHDDNGEEEYFLPILHKWGITKKFVNKEVSSGGTVWTYHGMIDKESFLYQSDIYRPGRAYLKEIPDIVFRSSREAICSYLRGLFQADGWRKRQGSSTVIGFIQVSLEMCHQVQTLLSTLGIESSIAFYHDSDEVYHAKRIKIWGKDYNTRRAYQVYIRGEGGRLFRDYVGFSCKSLEEYNFSEGEYKDRVASIPIDSTLYDLARREGNLKKQVFSIKNGKVGDFTTLSGIRNLYSLCKLNPDGFYKRLLDRDYIALTFSRVESLNIRDETYDVLETIDHMCLYDLFLTHQCMEGHLYGSWRERSVEDFKEACRKVKEAGMRESVSMFSFNCVDENTLLHNGERWLKAKDLKDSVETLTGRSKAIINRQKSNILLEIKTKSGYTLKVTPNHRHIVLRDNKIQEVLASDVRVEDYALIRADWAYPYKDYEFDFKAYIAGLFFGDGVYIDSQRINLYFNPNEHDLKSFVEDGLRDLGIGFTRYYGKSERDEIYLHKDSSQELVSFIRDVTSYNSVEVYAISRGPNYRKSPELTDKWMSMTDNQILSYMA